MKVTKVNKDIYNIVSDYFRGQLSDKDNDSLQNWLAASPENKKVFYELEKVWKITGEHSSNLNPDVDAEWERFVAERGKANRNNNQKAGKTINLRTILRVAAVFIPAFIILSATLYYFGQSGTPEMLTITTTIDKKECLLSDGSTVWINRNSTFIYPEKFTGNERIVELKGEAFFEVKNGETPFRIKTENAFVTVVGTAFNVRALEHEKFTEVVVNHGVVELKANTSNKKEVLNAGEKGTYDELTQQIKKEKVADYNSSAWKDDQLSFQDTPLKEMEIILTRYFGVSMYVAPAMKQCKFTGKFKQPQLNDILDVVAISLGATYQMENDTVFIKGEGCNN